MIINLLFCQLKNAGGESVYSGPKRPKPRQTPEQANWNQSMKNSDKLEQDTKYSAALKEATTLYSLKSNKLGCRKVAALMNAKHSLEGRTINYRTLVKYTTKGSIGKSPEKLGRKSSFLFRFGNFSIVTFQ